MTENSLLAWAWMLAAMFGSTVATGSATRFLPWSEAARRAAVPVAFSVAAAPLLLGLLTVLPLALMPGHSHGTHLAIIAAALVGIWLCRFLAPAHGHPPRPGALPRSPWPRGPWPMVLVVLMLAWSGLLIAEALFIPLIQNDSLEYATVGRLLFETRDLSSYPAIDPAASASGFFGPWTHPPLYPALIYLTSLLQGHADAPGLMRVIAPWFALTGTTLILSLGRMLSPMTGLLAALFFLSTPLYFLGAGSALIDALPVQGMVLLLSVAVALEGSPLGRGAAQGLVLGAALWTHSQAILFIPLAGVAILLCHGARQPRDLFIQLCTMALVALTIAAAPYWRNVTIYGSIVSDNPAVFALKELGWVDYFRMQRGLDTWADKIQYGLFKGWFAPEAYALVFWFMTLGLIAYGRGICSRFSVAHQTAGGTLLRVSAGLIGCYLLGIVASIVIGIDLMIRNERYLLVLLPCVALFAGVAVTGWATPTLTPAQQASGDEVKHGALGLLLLLSLAQMFVVGSLRWRTLGIGPNDLLDPIGDKLKEWPAYTVVSEMPKWVPADGLVLSMKPADMYYANRRMLSYLDPTLLPFYRERDVNRAIRLLTELGVTHIHVPDYSLPPIYNSTLQEIVARPDLSSLIFSDGGHQLYRLAAISPEATGESRALEEVPWTQVRQIVLGGRKSSFRRILSQAEVRFGERSELLPVIPIFLRERSTALVSGTGIGFGVPREAETLRVSGSTEYKLDMSMSGSAFVQVNLLQYDAAARLLDNGLIGEIALNGGIRTFSRRFITRPDAATIRVHVEHRGQSSMQLQHALLYRLALPE